MLLFFRDIELRKPIQDENNSKPLQETKKLTTPETGQGDGKWGVYLMTTGSQLTNPKKGFMVCM